MRPKTKKILSIYTILVFLYFYVPIVIVMIFSFNNSKLGTVWTGFTFKWYERLVNDSQILGAAKNSLIVALSTTIISCIIGTLAALAFHKYRFPGKKLLEWIFYIPVVLPDIVMGISLLALYAWLHVSLGVMTVIPGHVAFCISFVFLVVLSRLAGFDRSLEEAAKDLGANGWQAFWKITFPLVLPGILSGALLSFTMSLDEFVIAFFTTGPGSETLPVLIYSMVRMGISPEINALATILVLLVSLTVLIVGLGSRKRKKSEVTM